MTVRSAAEGPAGAPGRSNDAERSGHEWETGRACGRNESADWGKATGGVNNVGVGVGVGVDVRVGLTSNGEAAGIGSANDADSKNALATGAAFVGGVARLVAGWSVAWVRGV